jgi:hypothetical protein
MNIAAVFYRKGVTYPQAFRGSKKILHLVMYAPVSSAKVFSHPKLIGVGKAQVDHESHRTPRRTSQPLRADFHRVADQGAGGNKE